MPRRMSLQDPNNLVNVLDEDGNHVPETVEDGSARSLGRTLSACDCLATDSG